MKISVQAKPGAHENSVTRVDAGHYIVSVTEPPVAGRANRAIIQVLGEYLNIHPGRIIIIAGHTNRSKIVEIK